MVWASLKSDLLFSVVICVCLSVVKEKSDSGKSEENLRVIQVSVCYILKRFKNSLSNCTEELGLRLLLL